MFNIVLKKIGNSVGFLIPSYIRKKLNLDIGKEYKITIEEKQNGHD